MSWVGTWPPHEQRAHVAADQARRALTHVEHGWQRWLWQVRWPYGTHVVRGDPRPGHDIGGPGR